MAHKPGATILYSALCEYPGEQGIHDATVSSSHSPAYWPGEIVDVVDPNQNPVRALILGVVFRETNTGGQR